MNAVEDSLKQLEERLKTNVDTLVDAVDNVDPITEDYHKVMLNLDLSLAMLNNVEMILNPPSYGPLEVTSAPDKVERED